MTPPEELWVYAERLRFAHGPLRAAAILAGSDDAHNADVDAWRALGLGEDMSGARHLIGSIGPRQSLIEQLAESGKTTRQIAVTLGVGLSYVENVVRVWRYQHRRSDEEISENLPDRCERHADACLAHGGFPAALRLAGRTVHIYPNPDARRSPSLNREPLAAE